VENNRELLGACGLYCGACYHYLASFDESIHLREVAMQQRGNLEGYFCQGCRSELLYVHPGCSQCEIRACANSRNLDHCGQCTEYPCVRIKAFQSDGRLHHRDILVNLAELIQERPEHWLEEQAKRWKCECGARFSWFEQFCSQCGALLASYGCETQKK